MPNADKAFGRTERWKTRHYPSIVKPNIRVNGCACDEALGFAGILGVQVSWKCEVFWGLSVCFFMFRSTQPTWWKASRKLRVCVTPARSLEETFSTCKMFNQTHVINTQQFKSMHNIVNFRITYTVRTGLSIRYWKGARLGTLASDGFLRTYFGNSLYALQAHVW